MISYDEMKHAVDVWGVAVIITAAIVEAILVIGRKWFDWPTMSMVFRDDGKQWLSFPLSWGILGGHWWGPWGRLFEYDFFVWIVTLAAVLARDIVNRWNPTPLSKRWTFAALVVGVAFGAIFWSTGV